MNLDEIRKLADQAGWPPTQLEMASGAEWARLERFASLVAADERIACAISCEVNAARWVDDMRKNYAAHECAAAIRARSAP